MFGWLKKESGIHRLVRISPFDSSAKRHTSFASVKVMPYIEQDGTIEIDETELKIDVYRSGGAGGPGPGKIYIGNNNGWDVAYVTGILTVSSTGPNTGDVLRVSGGGRNALTIAWDNLTPFMSYSLVSGRQSRFLSSSSYYFDNNFLIGTTTDAGYKLDVLGTGRIQNALLFSLIMIVGIPLWRIKLNYLTIIFFS